MERKNRDNAQKELLEKVKYFDQQIEYENIKLHQINTAQEYLTKLKNNIDRCSEIVSNSLERGPAKQKFDNLVNKGNLDFVKTCSSFEEQADLFRQKITSLKCDKENEIRKYEENAYDNE